MGGGLSAASLLTPSVFCFAKSRKKTENRPLSSMFSVNPINVQIANDGIKFYASIYAGLTYSSEGLEIGPEIYIIMDYKTGEIYNLSEDLVRMSDWAYSVSAYKEIGASVSIGFDTLY